MILLTKYLLSRTFISIIIFVIFQAYSLCSNIYFEHLNIDNGLSNNTIHALIQDNKGFIWIGTEDGFNMFDGYNFTLYKNKQLDQFSIPDNFIWSVVEDNNGLLWIGTSSSGIVIYNKLKGKFYTLNKYIENMHLNNAKDIRAIFKDSKGNIWAGSFASGLLKLSLGKQAGLSFIETQEINYIVSNLDIKNYRYKPGDTSSLSDNHVLCIEEDIFGNIWAGTGEGLNKYNENDDMFDLLEFHGNDVINTLYSSKDSQLWIGTESGLFLYEIESQKFNYGKLSEFRNYSITSICPASNNEMLVGTGNGLILYNLNNNSSVIYFNNPVQNKSLSGNHITTIMKDEGGVIWIGTAQGGLNQYDSYHQKFNHYKKEAGNELSLSHNTIRSLFVDSKGIVYIGTLGEGIDVLDRAKNTIFNIKGNASIPNSLSNNEISSITMTGNSELWIGTWGGGINIGELDHENKKIIINQKYSQTEYVNSLTSDVIQKIFIDSKNRIWIGTELGLNRYIKENGTFVRYLHDTENPYTINDNRVQSCIVEDDKGNIWVGTWGGLNKLVINNTLSNDTYEANQISQNTEHFISFTHSPDNTNSLSDNRIISLFCNNNILWIGTYGKGLNKLDLSLYNDPESAEFVKYTSLQGLANDVIYGIYGDDKDNLWMSTNNGLSKFNIQTEIFKNFDVHDGLQSNQFFWGAHFQDKRTGEIFFGGINGFNSFFPDSITENQYTPPLVFTNLYIMNRKVNIGEATINGKVILEKAISETNEIHLSYKDRVFSLEFSALHYASPENIEYAYMLEGFDPDESGWIYSSAKNRTVPYSNLNGGKYVFKVKSTNSDGVWSENYESIKIIITPPFYNRWSFRISLFFILSASLFLIFRRENKRRKLLEIKNMEAKERNRILQEQTVILENKNKEYEALQRKMERANYITTGIAEFSKILVRKFESIYEFSDIILKEIIQYFNVQAGIIYIYNKQKNILELAAQYGHSNLDSETFEVGETLVGSCFANKKLIFLNNIPENYLKSEKKAELKNEHIEISSGLGDSIAKYLVLAPIIINKDSEAHGIVELASFNEIYDYQIELIEELTKNMSFVLMNIKKE